MGRMKGSAIVGSPIWGLKTTLQGLWKGEKMLKLIFFRRFVFQVIVMMNIPQHSHK